MKLRLSDWRWRNPDLPVWKELSQCEEIRSAKTTKTKQNLNSGLDNIIGTLEINILEIKPQSFKGGNHNPHILEYI